MKKILVGVSLFLVLGVILAFFLLFFPGLLPKDSTSPRDTFSPQELEQLKEGDILLQAGIGLACDTIILALREPSALTHSGVLFQKNGVWRIAHSVNSSMGGINGVHSITLESLFNETRQTSLIVVRPRFSSSQLDLFLDTVRGYLQAQTPFDNLYNFDDSSALYCSEFVIKSLIEAGMEPLRESLLFQGPFIRFETLLQERFFNPILSHNPGFSVKRAGELPPED